MELITGVLTAWAIPIAFLVLVATAFGLMVTVTRNYHTVSPNQVAVVSGRKRQMGEGRVGYRVITGGGFLKLPIIERVDYLFLNVMNFGLDVTNVPGKDGALVTVRAIANVKILSDEASLGLAIERFLGRPQQEILAVAKENLESNLRAIVGTLTIEQLIQDRNALQQNVIKEAASDLARLGLGLDLLNIQDVRDERGYIEALGKTRTAEVKRDATIGEANATKDAMIKSASADQAGKTARAAADQAISDAERQKAVVMAENAAKTTAAQARIEIIAQVAAQEEQAKLNVATVEAKKARVTAETELQALELRRKDAELKATVIVTAEREKDARIIAADAAQQAAEREGEALRIRQEKEGQGVQARQLAEAEGRKSLAAATRAELEAQAYGERAKLTAVADGERAMLMARAEGSKAQLMAEAEAIKVRLLAEAEGALKKAEAFNQLDDTGRLLMVMEASPTAIAAVGAALSHVLQPAAAAIGAGLGNIKEVRVVDLGGARNGHGVLQELSNLPVQTILGIVEQAKAAGLGPMVEQIISRIGLTTSAAKGNGAAHDDTVVGVR